MQLSIPCFNESTEDPFLTTKHRTRWSSQSLVWANDLSEFVLMEQGIQKECTLMGDQESAECPFDSQVKTVQDSCTSFISSMGDHEEHWNQEETHAIQDISCVEWVEQEVDVSLQNVKLEPMEEKRTMDSQLIGKLFPGLSKKECTLKSQPLDSCIKDLQVKIQTLEQENASLKQINSKLERAKLDLVKKENEFKSQKLAFERYKLQETDRLQQLKENEMKLLKREQLLWEKQKRASEILPNKKDRQDLECLKQQLQDLGDGYKQKESRFLLSIDRFKRRIDDLTRRNQELQHEVRVLEQDRAQYVANTMKRSGAKSKEIWTQTLELSVKDEAPPISQDALSALNDLESVLFLSGQNYRQECHADGKYERHYNDFHLIWYPNGTVKQLESNGKQIIYFVNGDKKELDEDGTILYWYAEPKILHSTYPNGLQVYEFENGQIEKHFGDGSQEILFPDKTVKFITPHGEEESFFPDGKIVRLDSMGRKTIEYPDGSKDIYSSFERIRMYSDGTIKKVYPDGRQETRWKDGRRRIKDASGRILQELH